MWLLALYYPYLLVLLALPVLAWWRWGLVRPSSVTVAELAAVALDQAKPRARRGGEPDAARGCGGSYRIQAGDRCRAACQKRAGTRVSWKRMPTASTSHHSTDAFRGG